MVKSCGTASSNNTIAIMTGADPHLRFIPLLLVLAICILSSCSRENSESAGAPLVDGSLQGVEGRIAFASHTGISVINVDGSHLTHLAPQGSWPSWSPDGSQIVFANSTNGNTDIYLMNVDGSGMTRLTTTGGIAPSWSPNGRR